jgi:hypothetical protein
MFRSTSVVMCGRKARNGEARAVIVRVAHMHAPHLLVDSRGPYFALPIEVDPLSYRGHTFVVAQEQEVPAGGARFGLSVTAQTTSTFIRSNPSAFV